MNIKKNYLLFDIVLYSFLAYPFVITGGYYANYLYIFLPLSLNSRFDNLLKDYIIKRPINSYFYIYFSIYVIGFLYFFVQSILGNLDFSILIRQSFSFFAFVSIFFLSGYIFTPRKILALKIAILLISIIFSLKAIYGLASPSMASYYWAQIKYSVGEMRNGCFYIISFCLLYFDDYTSIKLKPFFNQFLKNKLLQSFFYLFFYIILLIGALSTFSRATYLSLLFLILIITFIEIKRFDFKLNPFVISKAKLIYLIPISIFFYMIFSNYSFIKDLIITLFQFLRVYIFDTSLLAERLSKSASSESIRIDIISDIIRNTFTSPLIGTSYLGYWFIKNSQHGSAHSQHFDILMKTGLFGFLIYLKLLYFVIKRIYYIDISFFYSLLTTTFFGFFSETYRFGGLSFIFASLISISINHSKIESNLLKD